MVVTVGVVGVPVGRTTVGEETMETWEGAAARITTTVVGEEAMETWEGVVVGRITTMEAAAAEEAMGGVAGRKTRTLSVAVAVHMDEADDTAPAVISHWCCSPLLTTAAHLSYSRSANKRDLACPLVLLPTHPAGVAAAAV